MAETVNTATPEALTQKALAIPEQAQQIQVRDDGTYILAADFLKAIKGLRKQVKDVFGPLKAKAHDSWKAIVAEEKKADGPLEEATNIVKRQMADWEFQQEQARAREQRRLEAEAKAAAEEERLRVAVELEDAGRTEEAEAVVVAPVIPHQAALPKATPAVTGISHRTIWRFRITNAALLPREFLIPDDKAIGALVRVRKGATVIPGVEVYDERITVA